MCVHLCLCDTVCVCMCRLVLVGSLLPPHGAQRLNSVISPLEAPVLTELSHQPSRTFKNKTHNSVSILVKEMQIEATPRRFFFLKLEGLQVLNKHICEILGHLTQAVSCPSAVRGEWVTRPHSCGVSYRGTK